MSRMRNWIGACVLGLATTGLFAGASTPQAAADDARLTVTPAIQTAQQSTSVEPVRWRGGYGYRGGYGGYYGRPGVSVYVGPRYGGYYGGGYGGYYRPRYYGGYGGYYGGYRSYPSYGYGYSYPSYGYGYSYPSYGYSGGGYYW